MNGFISKPVHLCNNNHLMCAEFTFKGHIGLWTLKEKERTFVCEVKYCPFCGYKLEES